MDDILTIDEFKNKIEELWIDDILDPYQVPCKIFIHCQGILLPS